jgi:Alpha-2-macroglobulin bait region domain
VKIEVKGNGEWEKTYIVVIGRTGVVYNNVHEKNKEEKTFTIEFGTNNWMAPSINVIIYYFQVYGEIVYDRIQIDFDSEMTNRVS